MKNLYLKSIFIFFCLVLISKSGNARIITVSNSTLTAGQYTDIQTAINAAVVDDTVYLTPSPSSYGNFVINKRIILIGGGFNVSNTQYNWISQVGNIDIDSTFNGSVVKGTKIQGLKFYSFGLVSGSGHYYGVDNVTIERCWSESTIDIRGKGWIIKNSVTGGSIVINNYSNTIIANNFIGSNISTSNNPSTLIVNNMFMYYSYFSSLSYVVIANNIFLYSTYYYSGNIVTGCSQCTFNNNISYAGVPLATLPGVNNTGGNNLNNTNPLLIATGFTTNNNLPIVQISTYDWHLQAGSPGRNAGTDGKDIGIYGGTYPPANLSGLPSIPQMQNLNINNAVIPQGGTLNVTFKAKKQN